MSDKPVTELTTEYLNQELLKMEAQQRELNHRRNEYTRELHKRTGTSIPSAPPNNNTHPPHADDEAW